MLKIADIKRKLAYYRALASDAATPRVAKYLIVGAIAYLLSPIDLIPDFIPVLGYLDDLVIVPLMIWLALLMIPGEVKQRVADSLATTDGVS